MRTMIILAIITLSSPAMAHSWFPNECCENEHCFEIDPETDVKILSGGYYIIASREFIPQERVRETPTEGRDHWARCTSERNPTETTFNNFPVNIQNGDKACFYVPPTRF